MCRPLAELPPLELPASGVFVQRGGSLSYHPADPAHVALLHPGGRPARGFVAIQRGAGGRWRPSRLRASSLPEARLEAAALAKSTGALAVLGEVSRIHGDALGVLGYDVAACAIFEPVDRGDLLARAAADADAVGALLEHVAKARPLDPMLPGDYSRIVSRLTTSLHGVTGTAATKAIDSVFSGVRWSHLSDDQLRRVTRQLNRQIAAVGRVATSHNLIARIDSSNASTASATRRSVRKRYNLQIGANLSQRDVAAVRRMGAARAHYIRDAYGVIAEDATEYARIRAQEMINAGMGSSEIGRVLHAEVGGLVSSRDLNYWRISADAWTNRSRNYSALRSYRDSGFTVYRLLAVIDEATTEICRWLDGQIMAVEDGLQSYQRVDAADDPRAVEVEQPWFQERRIKAGEHAGKKGIYLRQRDGWRRTAVIEKPAHGKADQIGTYSNAWNPQRLAAANVGAPPYHAYCRTASVPEYVTR